MSAHEPQVPPVLAEDFGVALDPRRDHSMEMRRSTESSQSGDETPLANSAVIGKLPATVRRTVGIILLLTTVFFWTASNFLASGIFADNTYSKPFFLTYINTSFFALPLIPMLIKHMHDEGWSGVTREGLSKYWTGPGPRSTTYMPVSAGDHIVGKADDDPAVDTEDETHQQDPLVPTGLDSRSVPADSYVGKGERLSPRETAKLSLEFCMLWFAANYFSVACLQYTAVASATILTSTSSIWTLLFGSLVKVEKFTAKKLIGVLACMAGIILISSVDVSGDNDENRGEFPHKSQRQIAIGDVLALISAIFYGVYITLMKKRVGDESRVNMPLFFGLVGLFNLVLLWPGFIILHFAHVERLSLPTTSWVWGVILINSATSLVSDFCWAYAVLLLSPLVVTVGLSLTIPLSLVGQMVLDAQYSSAAYWVGAVTVFLSFIFLNYEDKAEQEQEVSAQTSLVAERDQGGFT